MKRGKVGNKSDSKFSPFIYTVVSRNHTMITVQGKNGTQYTRDISFFKTVPTNQQQPNKQSPGQSDVKEKNKSSPLKKTYPKRNRTSFKIHMNSLGKPREMLYPAC